MCSVALKKGVEEPWTSERVAQFIDVLGYREITLNGDTEPGIFEISNSVAEMCRAEATTEDAVKGDRESNGFIENMVMLTRAGANRLQNKNKCHMESSTQEPLGDESPILPRLVGFAGCILSRCQQRS